MVGIRLLKLHEIAKLKQKDVEKIRRYQESSVTIRTRPEIGFTKLHPSAKEVSRADLVGSRRREETVLQLANSDRPGPSKSPEKSSSSPERNKRKSQDKAVQMRQNLSAEKLHPNDDPENEPTCMDGPRRIPRHVLIGWDNNRTKIMFCLVVLLLVWAGVYFPLIAS